MALIANQRHLFDIPEEVAYFNMATMGPLPRSAFEAGVTGLSRKLHPWTIQDADFFEGTERLRPLLARTIGADTDGIAFIPSVSYGLSIAAHNLPVSKGQEILVLADQFPSNVYTWRAHANSADARVRTVREPEPGSLSDALVDAIGPDTAIVACPHVRWTDGALIDLDRVASRCRQAGAALVLDLTQSCGALRFDTGLLDPDFVVTAGYKWLMAPYTTGFLYAAPRHRSGRPLEQNWITRQGASDFARLIDYTDELMPGAQRFDMGERSNFALLPAFEEAVRLILDWGIGNIEASLAQRNRELALRLAAIGLSSLPEGRRGPHYLSVRLPEGAPGDLAAQLRGENIHVSRRGDRLRITQHLFTSDTDTGRLTEALGRLLA